MKFKKADEYTEVKKESPIINHVKIDNVNYSVIERYSPIISDGREVAGLISYKESLIEIANGQSPDNKVLCLMHEIVHGITVERDVKYSIPADVYEKVISEIANGFIQVIRDNPQLIEFIK